MAFVDNDCPVGASDVALRHEYVKILTVCPCLLGKLLAVGYPCDLPREVRQQSLHCNDGLS